MDNEILILIFVALVIAGLFWLVGYNYGVADQAAIQRVQLATNTTWCPRVNLTADLKALHLDVSGLRAINWSAICQAQLNARGPEAVRNCTDYVKSVGLDLGGP